MTKTQLTKFLERSSFVNEGLPDIASRRGRVVSSPSKLLHVTVRHKSTNHGNIKQTSIIECHRQHINSGYKLADGFDYISEVPSSPQTSLAP